MQHVSFKYCILLRSDWQCHATSSSVADKSDHKPTFFTRAGVSMSHRLVRSYFCCERRIQKKAIVSLYLDDIKANQS